MILSTGKTPKKAPLWKALTNHCRPQWQKDFYTLVVSILAMIGTGTLGPILTPGANQIIAEFDTTFTNIAVLTGYQLLSIACVGPLVVVIARVWGKRPVYVISAWIMIIGVIVAASAQTYNTLLAGRIVQGIGGACFEGLVTPFIGDLYFVHQRGARIAAYTMALWTGSMFGLIPTGLITQNLGWRWTFIIAGIFLAVFAVLLTLFVPESSYLRASVYDLDVNGDEGIDTLNAKGVVMQELQADKEAGGQSGSGGASYGPRKTWIKRMSLYNGRFSPENPVKMILRPWALLLHFPLFWNMIFTGMSQVFSVGISYLIPAVYGVPPYNLSPAQLGYIGAGPVCGVILAALFSGFTFDRVATWAARHNNGVYEVLLPLYVRI
jgi:MFS family permease